MSKKIILGKALISTLNRVNDRISTILLDLNSKEDTLDLKFSYIESEIDPTMFSYLPMNKEEGLSEDDKWKVKVRTSVKIGRVVRSILQSKNIEFNDAEIEVFVNKYRCSKDNGNFVLSYGKDFGKYYIESTYQPTSSSGTSLWNSCMRFEKCQEWFTLYKENSQVVGVLALLNDAGKVEGRALIWKDVLINGIVGTYMDRVYSISDSVVEKFKQYGIARGWWVKVRQGNDNPDITNGIKSISMPCIIAEIRSDVNYNYNVKSPYVDSLRQMKFLNIDGEYKLYLTNNLEKNSCRQNFGDHQSNVIINNEYSHALDKPFSLAQVLNKNMKDFVKIDENTFSIGEETYQIFSAGSELNNSIKKIFLKNPFENIVKFGLKIPNLSNDFYRSYKNELIKYVRENKDKVFATLRKDPEKYVRIFSKLSREEFLDLVRPFITNRDYYRRFVDKFQRCHFGFTQVVTAAPYNFSSWTQLDEFSEINCKIIEYGYDNASPSSRKAVYEVAGMFLEEWGTPEIKQRFFSAVSLDEYPDSTIIDMLLNSSLRIDVLDFIEKSFTTEEDKYKKIERYINLIELIESQIKESQRKKLLSIDEQEHHILRHYIYKIK